MPTKITSGLLSKPGFGKIFRAAVSKNETYLRRFHVIPSCRSCLLKWFAQSLVTLKPWTISFSRGSSWPRDWTCGSCIDRWILYHWTTWKAHSYTFLLFWELVCTNSVGETDSSFQTSRCTISALWTLLNSDKHNWLVKILTMFYQQIYSNNYGY